MLDDVHDLLEYWKDSPPTHLALGTILSAFGGQKAAGGGSIPTPEELKGLAARFGG